MPRVLLVVTLLVVSCAGDSATSPTTSPPTTVAPTAATTTATPATPPEFGDVTVSVSADGMYLVDEEGFSLYLFTLDDSRTSSCTGPCAESWPPLLGSPVAGEGVEAELLGNAERGNGAIQVTYAGHPLYTHSGDAVPGDTEGHGFNDVWFLVGPDGAALDGSP